MDKLQTLSDDELVVVWIDHLTNARSIEHVGAYNRHFGTCMAIEASIVERGAGGPDFFKTLLDHPVANVRYTAAYRVRESHPDLFLATMTALSMLNDDVGRDARFALLNWTSKKASTEPSISSVIEPSRWTSSQSASSQSGNSPPMNMQDIEKHLRAILHSDSDQLLKLSQPAIRLWPQPPRANLPVHASRLGGMPHAPPGFEWPMAESEPMLFLGQINCADLKGLAGAEHFPSQGLLALFGDYDTINGCMFTALGGAVRYWPDIDDLVPAIPPLELSNVFLVCELAFQPFMDMPHPDSEVVRKIVPKDAHIEKYRAFHEVLRMFAMSNKDHLYSFGKLLGWPHLVQGDDLDAFLDGAESAFRLLIQLDSYSDGESFEGFGPGGSLYFMIPEDDFAAGRLEAAQLTGQFT